MGIFMSASGQFFMSADSGASLIGRQLVEPISAILRFTAKWITEQARRRFGLVMWHTPGVKDVVSRDMPERHEPS